MMKPFGDSLDGRGIFFAASGSAFSRMVSGESIVPFEIGKSLSKVNFAASDALSEALSAIDLAAS